MLTEMWLFQRKHRIILQVLKDPDKEEKKVTDKMLNASLLVT